MAEKETKTLEGLTRYEFGALAGRLVEENLDYTNASLMLLNERLSVDTATRRLLDEEVYSNEKGIRKAAQVYAGAYSEVQNDITIGNLVEYYSLNGHLEGAKDVQSVRAEIARHSTERLGDVRKQYGKAAYILQGVKKGLYDAKEEEIRSAEETLRKYSKIIEIISLLEDVRIEGLRPQVIERNTNRGLERVAKQIQGKG